MKKGVSLQSSASFCIGIFVFKERFSADYCSKIYVSHHNFFRFDSVAAYISAINRPGSVHM